MFIRPETREELDGFEPDFTIINACSQVNEKWKEHNLNSEVAVAFNIEKNMDILTSLLCKLLWTHQICQRLPLPVSIHTFHSILQGL